MYIFKPAINHRIEQGQVFHYRKIVVVKEKQRAIILWLQFPIHYRVDSNTAVAWTALPGVGKFFERNDLQHLAVEGATEIDIRVRVRPELKFVP